MSESIDFSDDQKTQLRQCESAIRKGTKAFLEMCQAFRTIDQEQLWKGSHKSFPMYLKDRWHLDASTVSRYIKAAEVLEDLKEFETKPANEGQCRELGKLNPDQRRVVWSAILESDEKPTGRLISETAKEVGFIDKSEEKVEPPPKEESFISDFAMTVNALTHLRSTVAHMEVAEAEQVRQYIAQCRSELVEIEKALDG